MVKYHFVMLKGYKFISAPILLAVIFPSIEEVPPSPAFSQLQKIINIIPIKYDILLFIILLIYVFADLF